MIQNAIRPKHTQIEREDQHNQKEKEDVLYELELPCDTHEWHENNWLIRLSKTFPFVLDHVAHLNVCHCQTNTFIV